MSLRPGSRWTPSTQGIAGGIGSAFAGVSDQIRRVMQDRGVVQSSPPETRSGFATSGILPLINGQLVWQVPSAAIDGMRVAAYTVSVSATGEGDPPEFGYFDIGPSGRTGGRFPIYPDIKGGGTQFVWAVNPAGVGLVVNIPETPGLSWSGEFIVISW